MPDIPATTPSWRMSMTGPEPLLRKRVPTPTLAADGLLVRILAMGVCHSDCAIRDTPRTRGRTPPSWAEEFTLGHEGAGEIVRVGAAVDAADFRVGDRVALHIVPGCGACAVCRAGHQRICREPGNGGYGLGRDGFFQQYVAVRADAAVKVPLGVCIEHAAIAADAVLTAFHAVKYAAEAKPHHTIAIFGLGGLGLNAVQTAQHLGVRRILVVDKRQESVDIAVQLGIPREDAFCTGAQDAEPVHQVLAQRGIVVDTVIDFVGHEQTITSAQLTVRPAGLIVMVGLLSPQVSISPSLVATNMLTIRGSFAGTVDGLRESLELLAQGVIRPEVQTGSIEELPQVLRDLDEGRYQGRKVLLPDWSED